MEMGSLVASCSALLCVVFLHCFHGEVSGAGSTKYNTGAGIVDGKLNVHLVPHTHDDVGWLKTIDQYYVGSNNTIQGACVENVLDSVIMSLRRDPNRKFIYVEMAFFNRWWRTQSAEIQQQVRELVDSGQLEFVNGGWCMHDEATTHYIDLIDQTTLGHELIKSQFNKTPRAGWQIDPFGHSAVQAYLLGFDLGFDSIHFARIDYQDRRIRLQNKTLEVVWRGSRTFGGSNQIFTNAFPRHYSPPDGFEFEVDGDFVPVQDDPLLFDYNVAQRVEDFVTAALIQANVTRTNHIMWTMGDDFQYQYAESWFKQMDKLIHYVNKDGRVNALYSTPSLYTDAKYSSNVSWPLKSDDYFPYADNTDAYWTGYFTSRPAFKRYVRMLSGYYLAARQLEFLSARNSTGLNTYSLGDALGIAQHHDAVSGTAKQHTTDDYAKRLAIGESEVVTVVNTALSCLVTSQSSNQCSSPGLPLSQCQLLNISYCPPTEGDIPAGKSLVVVVYNPLGWNRTDIIKIPVNDTNLVTRDSEGNTVETQFVELDNITDSLRSFYVEAYTGISPKTAPRYWIFFQVSVPALGWNTYFISNASQKGNSGSTYVPEVNFAMNETITVGPGNLKLSFSSTSGQLVRMFNSRTRVDIPVQQSYLWYGSSPGDIDPQSSGAYIFRPNGSPPTFASRSVTMKVIRGPLFDEVHQTFGSWIYQVVRVYKEKEHAEFEYTIGEIPLDDGVGKEVITRFVADMATNKTFYTDSNGRDFLKRVRDYRPDWPLQVTQPVAGNYYPINLGIYTTDNQSEFSVLVDRAAGGSSISDGQIELMLHRRILFDDGRGVGEALDERVCAGATCQGLTVRGNYYASINQVGAGARWRRTAGQEIYSPLVVAYTQENSGEWKASYKKKGTAMDPNYSLPPNVAMITLQVLNDGSVLIRLAHLYEAGEDAEYSVLAKVDIRSMFSGKRIKSIKEMSLSANQLRSEMKTKVWKVEGDGENTDPPIRGGPLSSYIVELGPMEIRTFVLSFE
ncbi:OLC1v1011064C1 [Oldenlandia corymbosa var. corymbosa]|uniref:Alpha-mannosidase n=1 Tax=Oldenlandia corymbosa var. corymbosa TaxID=529605 RepID=A0AAV1DW85_OLDCO|nr:OLC1v1011064C1 [Oldenlandia corymbosa var. corymbosa]